MKPKLCLLAFLLCATLSLLASPTNHHRPFATPVEGVTNFNSLYSGNFVDLTGLKKAGITGLVAANVAGYDFRLFSDNSAVDFGIGIEPFTGQTALVYGYSQNGMGYTTALELSSNDGKLFDLKAIDITIDGAPSNVNLKGFRDGQQVAISSKTLMDASSGTLLTTFNTSADPNFEGIDKIRIEGNSLYAIGVDNVNAVNFRMASPTGLTLVDFTGQYRDNTVQLKWRSDNEVNTKNFEIQRSVDGNEFSSAGTVNSMNSPGQHDYSFSDEQVALLNVPNVFYRLRQNDWDGKFTMSPIIKIATAAVRSGLVVYPNPVQDKASFSVSAAQQQNLQVVIRGTNGKMLKKLDYLLSKGTNQIEMNVQGLKKGVYYLEASTLSGKQVTKFIKQ